jgi:PmbA protein
MAINIKKYFEAAKNAGLEPYQLTFESNSETTVSAFNDEIESQQVGIAQDVGAKAIYDGKVGTFKTDVLDNKTAQIIADSVLESAKFGREGNAVDFYHGGGRYRKAKTALKDFTPASLKDLRELSLRLAAKAKAMDPRVTKVEISLTCQETKSFKVSTVGVKAKDTMKVLAGGVEIVAENDKKEPRSGYESFYSFHDIADLEKEGEKAITKAVKAAVDFFGSGAVEGKVYKAVLNPDVVASLLGFFVSQLNAKSVQKHLSVFEGKMNTQITSKCLTIRHTPHVTSPSSATYDADGVPSQDFVVLRKGILENLFYSVETANVDKRESNGCASGNGDGAPIVLTVAQGRSTREDLFARMKKGLFITDVSGLNSGINEQTLDFSLPCQGYVVEDGKIVSATSMIIMSGNLLKLFNSLVACGNDTDYSSGIFTPSILVSELSISGK